MVTTTEKASQRVKLQIINPYTTEKIRLGGNLKFERLDIANRDELEFASDEDLEREQAAQQNAVLALITTPRMFEGGIPAPPVQVLTAYSHASFVHAFNLLSNEEKREIKILRTFWLGDSANMPQIRESSNVESIVSDLLVTSLAEKVRLYKSNVLTGRLAAFKQTLDASVYEGGIEYQEWLNLHKGKSKFDLKVIKSLAEGKKPRVVNARAFTFDTPVITDDEVERILDLVAKHPEPTLPYRPASINQAEQIANAINQILKINSQQGDK